MGNVIHLDLSFTLKRACNSNIFRVCFIENETQELEQILKSIFRQVMDYCQTIL